MVFSLHNLTSGTEGMLGIIHLFFIIITTFSAQSQGKGSSLEFHMVGENITQSYIIGGL